MARCRVPPPPPSPSRFLTTREPAPVGAREAPGREAGAAQLRALTMRESAEQKGRRYLLEGRLVIERVDERGVRARCRGGGAVYELGFDGSDWFCSCPALTRCAHLIALQTVTVRYPPRRSTVHFTGLLASCEKVRRPLRIPSRVLGPHVAASPVCPPRLDPLRVLCNACNVKRAAALRKRRPPEPRPRFSRRMLTRAGESSPI